MYIIGSETSDDEIPKVAEEIKKFITDSGGMIEKYEEPGKKKLAYPIKKSRIGYYVIVNFSAPPEKVSEIEHRIRTTQNIIRYLILNMDEALTQMEKDRAEQAKLKAMRPREEIPAEKEKVKREKKFDIDLDAEIEKALESNENIK